MHDALLESARDWLEQVRGGSAVSALRDTLLRRAISNAYYAVFHNLCHHAADLMAGSSGSEWLRVYRRLDHATCKRACEQCAKQGDMPQGLMEFATNFPSLHEARTEADYNPRARIDVVSVVAHLKAADRAIAGLSQASEAERRAFVLRLLFPERR